MSDFEKMKEEYLDAKMSDIEVQKMKRKMREAKRGSSRRWMAAAAAAVFVFMAIPNISADFAYAAGNVPVLGHVFKLVTFREYSFDDEKHTADVTVQGIEGLDDVNADITELAEKWIGEFEAGLEGEYEDLKITSDIIAASDDYFTLKISCEYLSADGYTEEHYYTIDRKTGDKVKLSSIYSGEGAFEQIKAYVISQMEKQMKEDENVAYFIEDGLVEITDETDFYINENGNAVIVFGQGEVGPMSMGVTQFEIPESAFE